MLANTLAYYLEDADITLRGDHLPLKKFLSKNTLNSKVNNWAIKISPFHITFEYIKGIKNMLANTMSRLIEIDPQVKQDIEPEGYEFGYYTFNPLPTMEVSNIDITQGITNDKGNEDVERLLKLPLTDDMLSQLQLQDLFCSNIIAQVKRGTLKMD